MRNGIDPDLGRFNGIDQKIRKAIQRFAPKVASNGWSRVWEATQKLDYRIKLSPEAFSQPRRSRLIVPGNLKNLLFGLRME